MGGPPQLTPSPRSLAEPQAGAPGSVDEPGLERAVIRRIAVCVDRSPIADRILPHAISIARALGAELTALHVVEPLRPSEFLAPADAFDWEVRRAEARRYLELIAARNRAAGFLLEAELIEGRAAEQIRDWVRAHDVDLTVLCSHGASGRTEWSLASTAVKLIEGLPGSLMLVPAWSVQQPPKEDLTYERIVVPLDGSPRAEAALPLAILLAKEHAADLVLAHVVPAPELTRVRPFTPEDIELESKLLERNERVGRHYLEALRSRVSERRLCVQTALARDRDIRGELLHIIERTRADLVVLSAHGHGGRTEVPLGSVATHLAEHGTTPLLIVREDVRGHATREPKAPSGRGPGTALTAA